MVYIKPDTVTLTHAIVVSIFMFHGLFAIILAVVYSIDAAEFIADDRALGFYSSYVLTDISFLEF